LLAFAHSFQLLSKEMVHLLLHADRPGSQSRTVLTDSDRCVLWGIYLQKGATR